MKTEIFQYVRDKKNQKVGLVLAVKLDDYFMGVGWSRCCKRDRFNKDMAFRIARGRAAVGDFYDTSKNAPRDVKKIVDKMVDRADRYFFKNGVANTT